ncbi:MAG: ribonuclease J [Candidatus Saccharibacteria bacterium]
METTKPRPPRPEPSSEGSSNNNNNPKRPAGPNPNRGPRPASKKPAGSKPASGISRGAAIRAQRRTQDDATKAISLYASAASSDAKPRRTPASVGDGFDKLKVTFLGGLEDVGEKNMAVIEWQNDAVVLDCGINLGIDLPGVNYAISDTTYLESIKHKLRAYIITHGHLDHIGGLKHTVPKFPAPIYGSRFTIGIVEKSFDDINAETGSDYKPELIIMNMDTHERLKVGPFMVEFVRVTHSIPEASTVVLDTPVGRIVATGDFRLDPEPLDQLPSDIDRLKQLGDEGVLLLLTESSYSDSPGRTPTEHTLQQSFHDVIDQANGRIFVAIFSSNMNRIQMVINAAVAAGRKVALDGRSMMGYAEIAVRQGILKVPKGTIMALRDAANVPDEQLLVMCTGGQGEPNAALQRMAEGSHKYIKLHPGDTVAISSSPIPGNEIRYDQISNSLSQKGVHLFRHPTHELDGCGPLHVSGHARRDELREMINIIRPKYIIPVHGGALRRRYHAEIAIEEGWKRGNIFLPNNGDSVLLTADTAELGPEVPHGSLLVDQTGTVVSGVVVKDRIMLAEEGLVAVILTVDRKTGNLLTSPDIISRGFIYMRDSEDLMNEFRAELRRAVGQRFKRIELDRFKQEIKEHVTHFLYEQTGRSPIVIPVVNVIGGGKPEGKSVNGGGRPQRQNGTAPAPEKSPEDLVADQQKRFQEMRARLLGSDQPN